MSIPASNWARAQVTGSPTAKAVLRVLADYADAGGSCWPSQAAVARDAELSLRAVKAAMGRLDRQGLISKTRRGNGQGGRSSDLIRLNIGEIDLSIGAPDAPRKGAPDALNEGGKVQISYGKGAPDAYESINNRQKKDLDMSGPVSSEAKGSDYLFESAWAAYPQWGRTRSSKAKALASWKQEAKLAGSEARLLSAVTSYSVCDDATKSGGQFVPGFDRWLKDGKWEHWGEVQEAAPSLSPKETELLFWSGRIDDWTVNQYWNDTDWGPRPGKNGCKVPASILAEHGLAGDKVIPISRARA